MPLNQLNCSLAGTYRHFNTGHHQHLKAANELLGAKMPQSKKKDKEVANVDYFGYFLLLVLIAVTAFSQPDWTEKVSVHHVWYYGWITAISTGLGSIPFYFFPEPDKFWMGVSNGGKMFFVHLICMSAIFILILIFLL